MSTVDGVAVTGPLGERSDGVLTPQSPGPVPPLGDAPAPGRWDDARTLVTEMTLADEHPDFPTVPASERMP